MVRMISNDMLLVLDGKEPLHDLDTSIQIFGGVIYHAVMRASGNDEKLSAALTMESAEMILDRFRERPDMVVDFMKVLSE